MRWWKRLFAEPRRSFTVDAVRLDLPMPVAENAADRRLWRDTDGHVISLHIVDDIVLPNPMTSEAVRTLFRDMAEERKGGLVEAELLQWKSTSVTQGIYKWREGAGFAFTGMLFIPVRHTTLVWTMVAGERGTTGIR